MSSMKFGHNQNFTSGAQTLINIANHGTAAFSATQILKQCLVCHIIVFKLKQKTMDFQ
jgi:hypothetical protein